MPIARDASGRSVYVPAGELYRERPADFFRNNPAEYQKRVRRARERILEVIRLDSVPLSGRGTCHEIRMDPAIGNFVEQLVNHIDKVDGRRVPQVRRQRKQEATSGLAPNQRRLRSPQDVKRRRSALFGGGDIPEGFFGHRKPRQSKVDRFVDLMRWYLIEEAVITMQKHHELVLMNDIWYVPVSVMDSYRASRRRSSHGKKRLVKQDDRSFHGRPNRDRDRVSVAA